MLHEGKWHKAKFAKCKGLKGRTIGLIGFGAIGKLVCKTAKAMEMNVLVHTRTHHAGDEEKFGFTYCTLDELLANSDIVSLHCPNTPQTKGMVNEDFLGKMKADGVLLNTSRGSVVVDEAIMAKLESCPDFWYGTDVFNGEPSAGQADWTSPISSHPRCYGTHHCGASTAQSESAIGEEAKRVIMKFASGGGLDAANTVNMAAAKGDEFKKLSVRYSLKVGSLSKIFELLTMKGCVVQEMENMCFKEREAAVCNMRLNAGDCNMGELAAELKAFEEVLDATV